MSFTENVGKDGWKAGVVLSTDSAMLPAIASPRGRNSALMLTHGVAPFPRKRKGLALQNVEPVHPTDYVATPEGTLAFSGYGDSVMQFALPDGTLLGPPPSNPWIGTSGGSGGCKGIVALDDGTICVTGAESPAPDFECTFAWDPTFTTILGFDAALVTSIACNYADHFYGVWINSIGANPSKIYKFDNTGTKVSDWTIDAFGNTTVRHLGMAPDESFAYYGRANTDTVTKRDLGGASSSTFTTETGYKLNANLTNSILVLRDGQILIAWQSASGGGTGYVKRYNAAGTLQATYTLPGTAPSPRVLTPGLDDTSFWISFACTESAAAYSNVKVAELQVSDGTVLNSFIPEDGTFEFDGPFCVTREDI